MALYDNAAGIYYLMAGEIVIDDNAPIRSPPQYLVVEGVHFEKVGAILDRVAFGDRPITNTLNLCIRKLLTILDLPVFS
jgi:hypothetical protein